MSISAGVKGFKTIADSKAVNCLIAMNTDVMKCVTSCFSLSTWPSASHFSSRQIYLSSFWVGHLYSMLCLEYLHLQGHDKEAFSCFHHVAFVTKVTVSEKRREQEKTFIHRLTAWL